MKKTIKLTAAALLLAGTIACDDRNNDNNKSGDVTPTDQPVAVSTETSTTSETTTTTVAPAETAVPSDTATPAPADPAAPATATSGTQQ